MSNADPRGKFVWHELLTSDTAGAGAFYPKVVSWKSQPWERDPSYTLWMGKAGPIGGVAALDESTGGPRWLAYIGVEDVHAAVAQAKSMGAKVLKDVTEMPETGTYAVLADPQGAEFAVYKSQNPSSGGGGPLSAGEFSWHELCTSDAAAAVSFYSKLCGWGIGPKHDMGPEFGTYHLMLQDGNQYVGIFQSTSMPPSWACYVKVDDVGKAANAAKAAGGRVINGPMEVPGGSWIAQILDPAGVMFAVHEEKMAGAEPVKASPSKASKSKGQKPAAPKAAEDAATESAPAAEKPAKPAKPAKPSKPAAEPAKAAAPAESKSMDAEEPAASAAPAKKAAAKAPTRKAAAKGKAPAKAAAKKAPAKKAAKKAAKKVARKAAKKSGKSAGKTAGKKVAKKAAKKSVARKGAKKAAPKKAARKGKKRR